jgi:hypothetical protein
MSTSSATLPFAIELPVIPLAPETRGQVLPD